MNYLLDTCFLSEFVKEHPNESVVDWANQRQQDELYLSVLTLGEIHQGIIQMTKSRRKTALEQWLHEELEPRFTHHILDITLDVAYCWGTLQGKARRRGRPLPFIDSLLAATALVYDATIVTRNLKDIQDTGVQIENPWA